MLIEIGESQAEWALQRKWWVLPGHLDLVAYICFGLPSVDPTCGLRLWSHRAKTRNHLFPSSLIIKKKKVSPVSSAPATLPEVNVSGGMDLETNLAPWHCIAEVISIFCYFREYCWLPVSDCTSLHKCQLSWLLWTSSDSVWPATCSQNQQLPSHCPSTLGTSDGFPAVLPSMTVFLQIGPIPWGSAGST